MTASYYCHLCQEWICVTELDLPPLEMDAALKEIRQFHGELHHGSEGVSI
jgi:hypothetical protein